MVKKEDIYFDYLINECWKRQLLAYPNPVVGSLIEIDNEIISTGFHTLAGKAHAELNAIIKAYEKLSNTNLENLDINQKYEFIIKNHKNIFSNANIYVTLEPCNHFGKTPPCAKIIKELNFKKVYIATKDDNKIASGGIQTIGNDRVNLLNNDKTIMANKLIEPFLMWQKNQFVFFKLALSLNGVYDNGIITSKNSQEHMHHIRSKIDLLVIGGNTVRCDKPTLDARLANSKAPDIFIYSHKDDFDKNIPLFKVPNRQVFIGNDLSFIKKYNLVMIEGGPKMLNELKDKIEYFLIYRSNKFKVGNSINMDNLTLKELSSFNILDERATWYKKVNK